MTTDGEHASHKRGSFEMTATGKGCLAIPSSPSLPSRETATATALSSQGIPAATPQLASNLGKTASRRPTRLALTHAR